MKNYSKRALFVNIFGTFGYLFCLFLWAWVGMLYLPLVLESEQVEQILIPVQSEEVPDYAPPGEMPPYLVAIIFAVTGLILITTVILAARAPIALAKTGKAATEKVAESALPLVSKHQKLAPAKKKMLTAKLVKLAKLLLVLAPVALGLVLGSFLPAALPFDLSAFVTVFLALSAILAFCAQYLFARLLKVAAENLV